MNRPVRGSWTEIRDRIRARILSRDLKPGDPLPRDQDLATDLGCSRVTVQRAMRDLADRGLVLRKRRGGTRVSEFPETRATLSIPILRLEVEARGQRHGYRLIEAARQDSPAPVIAAFGLERPEPMLRIQALHLADRVPYVFEDRWVSLRTVPEIADLDLERVTANEWLVLNQPYSRGELAFSAATATAQEAGVMRLGAGDAVFVMQRTTWAQRRPITTVRAIAGPDYRLQTEI